MSWIEENLSQITRKDAVLLGQFLVEKKVICHITSHQPFQGLYFVVPVVYVVCCVANVALCCVMLCSIVLRILRCVVLCCVAL